MTCGSGQACNSGNCGCATGQMMCGSTCVDPNSSANCGSCGHACGSTQHCATGACVDNATTGTGGTTGSGGATGRSGGMTGTGGTTGSGGATGSGGSPPATSSVVTSASGAYWKTGGTLTTVTSGTATVTVTDSSTAQTWEGFGGAFNELGWSYLSMLSASDKDTALHLLYGSDGARFNIGRVPIGANDYAISRYTDDEVASGSTDYNMTSFSLAEDGKYLIPYIKAAQALNGSIRFWGSPWTPPTWMKTSSGTVNGTACTFSGTAFDSGCMMDDAQVLTAYAQYFVQWVKGYAAQNITIESVGPQNEPNYFDNYPSCGWASPLFTKFVGQYLGPAFTAAHMTTKIMLGTMSNGNSGTDPGIVSAVLADATAKSYIKLFGYQWNMLPNVAAAKSYNLPIWQTEHKCGNYPWNPAGFPAFNANTAPNDYAYAVESWGNIHDWIAAGVTAYSAWNTVLDTAGKNIDSVRPWPQNALLTVNTSTKALTITPAYYVFRHCSQFVNVGAKVVATSGGSALAFKNPDGSIVTDYVQLRRRDDVHPGRGWEEAAVRHARQRICDRRLRALSSIGQRYGTNETSSKVNVSMQRIAGRGNAHLPLNTRDRCWIDGRLGLAPEKLDERDGECSERFHPDGGERAQVRVSGAGPHPGRVQGRVVGARTDGKGELASPEAAGGTGQGEPHRRVAGRVDAR